jgi:hypothetical protein
VPLGPVALAGADDVAEVPDELEGEEEHAAAPSAAAAAIVTRKETWRFDTGCGPWIISIISIKFSDLLVFVN